MTDAPHAIIVGAGFAGLSAVRGLRKAGVRVTIIDRNLYSTFQPLLYQVATGGLNPGDIAYPVGGFTTRRGTRYTRGELAAIDAQAHMIKLTDGRELGYDYLILATGVSANYFGVKGAAENTYGLYTRADAIMLRDRSRAGGHPGRAAPRPGARDVPRCRPVAGAHPAGGNGVGPADAVPAEAARVHQEAAGFARRRHQAGYPH